MRSIWCALVLAVVACTVSGEDDDDPPRDASADSSACGTTACGAGEFCIVPCCGGAPPLCQPAGDGGVCPPGTAYTDSCISTGTPGCEPGPCVPDPPYCSSDIPVGCDQQSDGKVVCTCA